MERYVIHVTKKCNLNCVYCYEKDKTSEFSWEDIKKLLDEIIKNNKVFDIEFLGGEPMLRFDLIQKSVEYLESQEDINVFKYIITTNGNTEITEDILEFFKKHRKISYAVSLDGGYFANQLRIRKDNKNSFDLAYSNIKKVIAELGSDRVFVHMVTHPYNVALIENSIRVIYESGVRDIGVGIIESTIDIGKEFFKEYQRQMFKVSDDIAKNKYPNLRIQELNYKFNSSDNKKYIRNENNVIIGETYGRESNDITSKEVYNIQETKSDKSDYIMALRDSVFFYHQRNLGDNR